MASVHGLLQIASSIRVLGGGEKALEWENMYAFLAQKVWRNITKHTRAAGLAKPYLSQKTDDPFIGPVNLMKMMGIR